MNLRLTGAIILSATVVLGLESGSAATYLPHPAGGGEGNCGDMSNYSISGGGGEWDYAHSGGSTSQAILDAGWSVHSNYTHRAGSSESGLYGGLLTNYSMHDRCPS